MRMETKFKVGDILYLVDKVSSETTELKRCSFCEGRCTLDVQGATGEWKEVECPECAGDGTIGGVIIQRYGIVSIKITRRAFEETEKGYDGVSYTYKLVDGNPLDMGSFYAHRDEVHRNIYVTKEEAKARIKELNK